MEHTVYQEVVVFIVSNINIYKGRYTYDVHENCPIFKTPHLLVQLLSKLFLLLDLGRPISSEPPPHPLSK